jgi:hypothetical protein
MAEQTDIAVESNSYKINSLCALCVLGGGKEGIGDCFFANNETLVALGGAAPLATDRRSRQEIDGPRGGQLTMKIPITGMVTPRKLRCPLMRITR